MYNPGGLFKHTQALLHLGFTSSFPAEADQAMQKPAGFLTERCQEKIWNKDCGKQVIPRSGCCSTAQILPDTWGETAVGSEHHLFTFDCVWVPNEAPRIKDEKRRNKELQAPPKLLFHSSARNPLSFL